MTPERREMLARGLAKNELLPELLAERREELRQDWENSKPEDAETRERLYQELKALGNLKEYIYAELASHGGDAGSNNG